MSFYKLCYQGDFEAIKLLTPTQIEIDHGIDFCLKGDTNYELLDHLISMSTVNLDLLMLKTTDIQAIKVIMSFGPTDLTEFYNRHKNHPTICKYLLETRPELDTDDKYMKKLIKFTKGHLYNQLVKEKESNLISTV